nr:hypothetical protein CFP56_37585 [Quercus suber]
MTLLKLLVMSSSIVLSWHYREAAVSKLETVKQGSLEQDQDLLKQDGGGEYQDQGKQLEQKQQGSTCIAEVQEAISDALVIQ